MRVVKRIFRHSLFRSMLFLVLAGTAGAGERVEETLHNLSASGPGEIRSLKEKEICVFCHIPHSAVTPEPLWGHRLSDADYRVPSLRSGRGGRTPAPQPDAASRLCLSCHDGTVALGDTGGKGFIPMSGASRLRPEHAGFIGTDLSGSHPISFYVPEPAGIPEEGRDMGLKPLSSMMADPDIRLDSAGKMQCTTCHDPHRDRYFIEGKVPHFWVKASVEEVCLTCHVLR